MIVPTVRQTVRRRRRELETSLEHGSVAFHRAGEGSQRESVSVSPRERVIPEPPFPNVHGVIDAS
jgi:hypothetical protein